MALIPAYGCEDTVGRVVAGALRHVEHVLVVDDGSDDDTSASAATAGAVVISHARNLGKGEALKTGFSYALSQGFDAVVTLDADGQHDPDEIPRLIEAADGGAGVVVGARLRDRDKIPLYRYRANMVGVAAISWRVGQRIDDTQSGFRLYKADVLSGLKVGASRFEAETEMLIRAGRRGFRIASVPVTAIYSEEIISRSHYRKVADTYRICILFLKSFLWRR